MSSTQRPDKAVRQPRLALETGQKGRIGVLWDLRQIQLSVPAKYFFVNKYRGRSVAGKPSEGGFLADPTLIKTDGYAGLYEEKLRTIEHQLRNLPNKARPY